MKEAFFMFLGAFITAGFTFFLDVIKAKRDEKMHLREKREEAYFKVIHFYDVLTIDPKRKVKLPENIDIMLHEQRAMVTLYGSRKVRKLLIELDKQFSKSFNGLHPDEALYISYNDIMKQIHKELGIKD